MVGAAIRMLAFAAVIGWGMRVSHNARTRFSQLAAAGLSATIFFYVAINLMMVMGLAPVVGVALPLVSFGGSAVMTVMLCLGLLMALERHQRTGSASAYGGWIPAVAHQLAPCYRPAAQARLLIAGSSAFRQPRFSWGRIAQLVE